MREYTWLTHPFAGQWVESDELKARVLAYLEGQAQTGWVLVAAPHGWKRWLFAKGYEPQGEKAQAIQVRVPVVQAVEGQRSEGQAPAGGAGAQAVDAGGG